MFEFLARFFKRKNNNEDYQKTSNEEIHFGRYMELPETQSLILKKDTFRKLYFQKNYFDSYLAFFDYLQEKSMTDSVKLSFNQEEETLEFNLIQGSKVVAGTIDKEDVFAYVPVVEVHNPSVALMNELLKENSELQFCKFALDEDMILLRQQCAIQDMSCDTFNQVLREMSTEADKLDDYLVSQFEELNPINTENIIMLSDKEVKTKLEYLKLWINQALSMVDTTTDDDYRLQILCNAIYKILFLVSPEGVLLCNLRKMVYHVTFPDEQSSVASINQYLIEKLQEILSMTDTQITDSMYSVLVVYPEHFSKDDDYIEYLNEKIAVLENCYRRGRSDIAQIIVETSFLEVLLKRNVNVFFKQLSLILLRTLNPDFFYALGFQDIFYNESLKLLAKDRIINQLKLTLKSFGFSDNVKFELALNFESLDGFAYSFLQMIVNMSSTN